MSLRKTHAIAAQRSPPRSDGRGQLPIAGAYALRLPYRPPYDFGHLLSFFAKRAIPGVEQVEAGAYRRLFMLDDTPGSLQVVADESNDSLILSVDFPDPSRLPEIAVRVGRMFDVDADIAAVNACLGRRTPLRRWVARHPGQRLPGGWDGFEIAVRAVLGQQISVAAARTLTERLVRKFGVPITWRQSEKVYLFPSARSLLEADLGGLGITGARIKTLRAVAQAVEEDRVSFDLSQSLEEFVQRWIALPGIGPWTAHYMAMRALSHPDAFPAADVVLRKAVARDGLTVSAKVLEQMAEAWRPYRSYAVLHLWRSVL